MGCFLYFRTFFVKVANFFAGSLKIFFSLRMQNVIWYIVQKIFYFSVKRKYTQNIAI